MITGETKTEFMQAWLSRHLGRTCGSRDRGFMALESWLSKHSVQWWPPHDERLGAAKQPKNKPLEPQYKAPLEAAMDKVKPPADVAVASSHEVYQEVRLRLANGQHQSSAAKKQAMDRLRGRAEPVVSGNMALALDVRDEFRAVFVSHESRPEALTAHAQFAAGETRERSIRGLLEGFGNTESRRTFLDQLPDEELQGLIETAQQRWAGTGEPVGQTPALVEVRKRLRELTDRRFIPSESVLMSTDNATIVGRAVELLSLSPQAQWQLPTNWLTVLVEVAELRRKEVLSRSFQGFSDPEELAQNVQGALYGRLLHHLVRMYLAGEPLPRADSLEGWSRSAASKLVAQEVSERREAERHHDSADALERLSIDGGEFDTGEPSWTLVRYCRQEGSRRPTLFTPADISLVERWCNECLDGLVEEVETQSGHAPYGADVLLNHFTDWATSHTCEPQDREVDPLRRASAVALLESALLALVRQWRDQPYLETVLREED